ncbi:MAG TPA: hypothetical protein PK006_06720 [Saprospiraceae bacterium]|nr:hypothetical protein [Saprospiraceae bacterium]
MLLGRMLTIPLILVAIGLIYLGFNNDEPNLYLIMPTVLGAVALLIFRNQINTWSLSKWPMALESEEKIWLSSFFLPYKNLKGDQLKQFEEELAFQMYNAEFIPMGLEILPHELKLMSFAPKVFFKIHKIKNVNKLFIRVALYPHPFITPDFENVHISETNNEDGLLIFSLEQLQASYLFPNKFFNTAFYEWAKILLLHKGSEIDLCFENSIAAWDWIEQNAGLSKEALQNFMGWEELDVYAVLITLLYTRNNLTNLEALDSLKQTLDQLLGYTTT